MCFEPHPLLTWNLLCSSGLILTSFLLPLSTCHFSPYEKRICGVLHSTSQPNAEGDKFTLLDEYQSVNLGEDHRAPNHGWNITGSVQVAESCKMTLCPDTYFDGFCRTLDQGSYSDLGEQLSNGLLKSVSCACARVCKCSDVLMKKSSCARAYLEGGCNTCNSLYTDLIGEKPYFPQEFMNKVESLRVRQGCTLSLYPQEHFTGHATIIDTEIVEVFKEPFHSYKCHCNENQYAPRVRPPRLDTLPPLINIPNTVDEVIGMLQSVEMSKHPGLLAALSSLKNRRSSKNSYILLLGTTGAGKSSAINLLFDNPNVTKVGDRVSTTAAIHEFRIPVAVDEYGVANSELRVIDTPGLSDTKGLLSDAKYLTSLDLYLAQHEELKDKIPNVVLIFHRFDDNRFDGEGSNFVKMIRAFDSFRSRITDENYSNVVFVLSHFCKGNKGDQRKPDKRLKMFKDVIENYCLFPRPTIITVAENKPWEEDLPSYNGFFKLPNNEYYPRSLFEKLELVTRSGGDEMGLGVFTSAFRDSENFQISQSTFDLVGEESSKVPYYLSILTNAAFGIEKTQTSQKLQHVWDNLMDSEIKRQFPGSLFYLQKTLNVRHINTHNDIPKTTTEILQLLTVIKQDEATRSLLEKALGIKPPLFQQNTVAGYSYNIFQDATLPASPFQMGAEVYLADNGFLIPNVLTCNLKPAVKENFIVFNDKPDYLRHRLSSLGIEGQIDQARFTDEVKPGFNVKAASFKEDSCSLSATREVRLFEFVLNDRLDLTQEFQETVLNLPGYNETDSEVVDRWKGFFDTYGTHVVHSVYGGGSIEVKLHSSKPFDQETAQALFSVIKFAEDMTFQIGGGKGGSILKEGTQHTLVFQGGDPHYHTTDLTSMSIENAGELLRNWKKSLKFYPEVLTTEMRLVPISQVAKKVGQNFAEEIDRATKLLFNSELKYEPKNEVATGVIPGGGLSSDFNDDIQKIVKAREEARQAAEVPESRRETPYVGYITAFLKNQEEAGNRLNQMMLKMTEMQMANERRQSELAQKQMEWQKEQKIMELQFKREEAQAEKLGHQEKLKWQQQLDAKRQQAVERMEAERRAHQQQLAQMQAVASRRMEELMKIIITKEPTIIQKKCLKPGTKILMGDLSERNVEEVNAGDLVSDMDLNPVSVMSVNSQFLESAKLYGFDKKSYFFTEEHVFVGPAGITEGNSSPRLYAKSSATLYRGNPLMKYLNVSDMHRERMEPFRIFHLDKNGNRSVLARDVNVYEDSHNYPANMPVYYIQVGGPSGTYFANGHVCRHGTPPFEYWPNTMSLLFRLVNTERFRDLAGLPYSSKTENYLNRLTDLAAWNVGTYLGEYDWKSEVQDENEIYQIMTLGDVDLPRIISEVFSSATGSALGEQLYVKVGQLIAPYLDGELDGNNENAGLISNENQVAGLQYRLFNVIYET